MENTKATLAGPDALQWLEAQGCKFCRVEPWNAKTASPGKKPMGYGWQEKPLTFDQVKGHLAGGGNAGLLTGHHSGGICILDVDKDYSEFIQFFPGLAAAPTITRDGADKGKIIIRITDTLPRSTQYIPPGEKHPVIEFLADGRQGVAAGIHPSQTPYKLVNHENEIPEYKARAVSMIWYNWTGQRLQEDTEPTRENNNGDGLRAAVLAAWQTLEVFKHFGRAVETKKERQELRLLGNGGLLVRADSDAWFCHADQVGGGPFEAWEYCKTGRATVADFHGLLVEMAKAANIPIPERKNKATTTQPKEPEYPESWPTEPPGAESITPPAAKKKPDYKTSWTVAELYDTEFPEPNWAVKGIIPAGLTLLGGKPKLGKSWLALQLAQAVSTGGLFAGIKVDPGSVFFLALEDSPRRLQDRLKKQRAPKTAAIRFVTEWDVLSEGGLRNLQNEVAINGYKLIIIDTLSRFIGGRIDQKDAGEVTEALGALQHFAITQNIAIVIVDHHRKPMGQLEGDPILDLLGSVSKGGVGDCALGLYRARGQHGATLKMTGRDVQEREMSLQWDGALFCWQYQGEADQVREDSERGKVLAAALALYEDGELPTTTKIHIATGIDLSNVSKALAELVSEGFLIKTDKAGKQQPYYPATRGNDEYTQ